MLSKAICFLLGHSWIISRRVDSNAGYSYYQYTCTCCGEKKEEL